MKSILSRALLQTLLLGGLAAPAMAATIVRTDFGATSADILDVVNQFRADVSLGGGANAPGSGPFTTGRRQVTWDGVPDDRSEPNLMPADQFLNTVRAGSFFETPGTGFLVSADNSNPTATPPLFEALNPAYAGQFQAFSGQRIFVAEGSEIIDTLFFVPSDPTQVATVNGFGVVFTDVDLPDSTSIEYFGINGASLGSYFAPASPDGGFSFLGVTFEDGERVARVRIRSGNAPLGAGNVDTALVDIVATDDFIYGEPQAVAVPEASTWLGAGVIAAAATGMQWRRRLAGTR